MIRLPDLRQISAFQDPDNKAYAICFCGSNVESVGLVAILSGQMRVDDAFFVQEMDVAFLAVWPCGHTSRDQQEAREQFLYEVRYRAKSSA